jgi:hypothetical protein
MKKSVIIEVIGYIILVILLIASFNKIHYTTEALLIYACLFSSVYFFGFNHWFRDEKNIALKILGMIIMSIIPIATVFIVLDYPGKDIVMLYHLVTFIPYWIIRRYLRNTIHQTTDFEKVWIYILFMMVPMTSTITITVGS